MEALHRRIAIATRELGHDQHEARATVEDDYHHFRVTVRAEQGCVREVLSESLRNPTTLCPAAGQRLSELNGMKLSTSSVSVFAVTDASEQCTHQFDLAGLAIAALGRGITRRVYEAAVPDRVEGRTTATLRRDGQHVLCWDVEDMTIVSPHAGQSLGAGFTAFTRKLPQDEAEAALVLRRALFISQGRGMNLDAATYKGPIGGCWAWQPSRLVELTRLPSSRRNFTGRPEVLGTRDHDWLNFET